MESAATASISLTEAICLPDDLAALRLGSGVTTRTDAILQLPLTLCHPAVLYEVLSAQNMEAAMRSLTPHEQHALLVHR